MEKGILLAGLGDELAGWLSERLSVPVREGSDWQDGEILVADHCALDLVRKVRTDHPTARIVYCLPASAYRAALRMLTEELRVDHIQIQPIDREELARLLDVAPSQSVPPSPLAQRPTLLVLSDDEALTEPLVAEARRAGYVFEVTPNPLAARVFLLNGTPHGVLVDVGDVLRDEDGQPGMRDFSLLAAFTGRRPAVPVLTTMRHCTFADRVEAARLGAAGFIERSMTPAEMLDTVLDVLDRSRMPESRLVVLSADDTSVKRMTARFEGQGMQVSVLDSPLRFWDSLEEFSPDLLILDGELPRLSGFELCRAVRMDPHWTRLPVIVLTADDSPDTVARVFSAGADDFIPKPVQGPELLARVRVRLERSHGMRVLAETDALTGVANRHRAGHQLKHMLRLARRQGQRVSFAILDVDDLKQINERHSHLMGDWVLRSLGALLLRSFRSEDVLGRWGGGEFVIGMFGLHKQIAQNRLKSLLRAFRKEQFSDGESDPFEMSFSCGLSEFPTDGTEVETLYRIADDALAAARSGDHAPQPTL